MPDMLVWSSKIATILIVNSKILSFRAACGFGSEFVNAKVSAF